jgi:2,3-bisphosphoglycerate-independent phosphoglycerate mutase
MDGVGERDSNYGNAVKMALTPHLNEFRKHALFTTLKAHGTAVGLPSDADMGNSEVGHNALGAGRVFDQGAKLVTNAISSGRIFEGECWKKLIKHINQSKGALHFIGLLSDGNVHSHQNHLHDLLSAAKKAGVPKVRLHVLLDGRDVPEKSAEVYVQRLNEHLAQLRGPGFDVKVASGGGRMLVTMDRYEADWEIVKRGWDAHVRGEAQYRFESIEQAISAFREDKTLTDQNLPAFVIEEGGRSVGTINDGDAVVLFNFRGDRAIEISRAFTEPELKTFDRLKFPKVFFAGMMEYDGDLHIPANYLVEPPAIDDTLSEYLVQQGLHQFACSETQKFGHVTYFWNGNRSGMFDPSLEEYLEVPSDKIDFQFKPWMKAAEITDETVQRVLKGKFDFMRINYANGDMVGHTGNFEAAVVAVATVDLMIGRLWEACKKTDTVLMITADHGNADEMFDVKKDGPSNWLDLPLSERPKPKTAHTLFPVPFYLCDPRGSQGWSLTSGSERTIGCIASTVIEILGLTPKPHYLKSLVESKS